MSRADPSTERVSHDKYAASPSSAHEFHDPFSVDETDELQDLPVLPTLEQSGSRTVARRDATSDSSPSAITHLSNADLRRALDPSAALDLAAVRAPTEKQFLSYERRGLWGQCAYNIGYSYFSGILVGGTFGFLRGFHASPNMHPRVVLNSVLNGSGKFGARAGNAMGVLSLIYTVVERQVEETEVDRLPARLGDALGLDLRGGRGGLFGTEMIVPASAAFFTGALFSIPRAVTMRGLEKRYVSLPKRVAVIGLGGAMAVAGVGVMSVVGPLIFGNKSPFRFV